jgi:Flp pilus assembly protein TadD
MSDPTKTVFISYRRDASAYQVRAIERDLRDNGFDVFVDVRNIGSGMFEPVILGQIAARMHFLVILTGGTLKRCGETGDWLRREIEHAIDLQRNIIPICFDDYKFTKREKSYLTGKLEHILKLNRCVIRHDSFEDDMQRLQRQFLKPPQHPIQITAARLEPSEVEKFSNEVRVKVIPAASTNQFMREMRASFLFTRALGKAEEGDLDGAIEDFTGAIRMKPNFVEAYNDRGVARVQNADFQGAIDDYSKAIRLDPDIAIAYSNRGDTRRAIEDFVGALADIDEAIRLRPDDPKFYALRSKIYFDMADLSSGQHDFETSIDIDPQLDTPYVARGIFYAKQGDLVAALQDFEQALKLKGDGANYTNRAVIRFAIGEFNMALSDYQRADTLKPNDPFITAGLAITHRALGNTEEANRLWNSLIAKDERYRDADWAGKRLNWIPPLIDAGCALIGEL